MEINKDLKTKIQDGSIGDSFLLLVYPDNTFLANQYVNNIARVQNRKRVYVDRLEDIPISNSFFNHDDGSIYILNVEKFESNLLDFSPYKNTIVICKKISDETKNAIKMTTLYFELSELEEKQIIKHMETNAPGLTGEQRKFIYDISKGDIYKINNEVLKINLFETPVQSKMFSLIKEEGGYSDVSLLNVYNLKDAVLKGDTKRLLNIMLELKSMDVEFMSIVSVIHRNVKDVINVVLGKKASYQSLKMKESQFKAIYGNYSRLSLDKLSTIFEFITSIDFELKSGFLQMSEERLIDYLVVKLLGIVN
jgi:hypothetical protein